MKTVLRKVYYCDFCKKHSLRSLEKHEKHCTGNQDRECRLCEDGVNIREAVAKVPARWADEEGFTIEVFLKDIRKFTTCPVCTLAILAAIRKAHPGKHVFTEPTFDYKAEVDAWWKSVNADQGA